MAIGSANKTVKWNKVFERHIHAAANKLKAKDGVEEYWLSEGALHRLAGTPALQQHAALMHAHVAVLGAAVKGAFCAGPDAMSI